MADYSAGRFLYAFLTLNMVMHRLKKFTLVLCACFVVRTASSQDLMQSLGVRISALFGTLTTDNSSSSFAMKQGLFIYFPRYNFMETDNSSLSIGFPVGAGVGLMTNSDFSDAGVSFAFDVPAVLDYNIGFNAIPYTPGSFGGYFGVGFGYYKAIITGSNYSDFNGATYGPMVRGGICIRNANRYGQESPMTFGIYYKKGLEKDHLNTIGLDILYDF